MYQLPGINYYLQNELFKKMKEDKLETEFSVQELILMDFRVFFDLLCSRSASLTTFEKFIKRFYKIIESRNGRFVKNVNPDTFVRGAA